MTEQPSGARQPDDADDPPADPTGDHGGRPGEVRTKGETAVDDAIGTGDNVH